MSEHDKMGGDKTGGNGHLEEHNWYARARPAVHFLHALSLQCVGHCLYDDAGALHWRLALNKVIGRYTKTNGHTLDHE